jgi:hypothetical protein
MGLELSYEYNNTGDSGDYWRIENVVFSRKKRHCRIPAVLYGTKSERDSGKNPIYTHDFHYNLANFPSFLKDPTEQESAGINDIEKFYDLIKADSFFTGYSNVTDPTIIVKQGTTFIDIDTDTHDFGDQTVDTSTGEITFTIKNVGDADLTLGGSPKVAKSGDDAAMFTINETSTSTPVTAGNTTTFTIKFTPTSTGEKTATISITNNDGSNNPCTFNLIGTGV